VYALDWLGVGLSSRPRWSCGTDDPAAAENWFAQSLESWRSALHIDRIHLVAHSLSAFFAVAYAETFPHRLESLTLASPAGIPDGSSRDGESTKDRLRRMPWGVKKAAITMAAGFWERGATPQSVIRNLPEFIGKGALVDSYVGHRFPSHMPSKPQFSEYMYRHFQVAPTSTILFSVRSQHLCALARVRGKQVGTSLFRRCCTPEPSQKWPSFTESLHSTAAFLST
jgi:pimeloyl-ACP methyl ester carboxylesterase